ncbi:hypothetical protein K1W54_29725 [Micromonospora sp. CPCC 205371]|nr:hypothetical protein [Micromonospora sp. CPCC 205371]
MTDNQLALTERPTALYRFFDHDGEPLYFGIAVDPDQRWRDHESTEWWPLVDHAKTKVEWHPDREAAATAERVAIKAERPKHNRAHAHYQLPPGVPAKDVRKNFAYILSRAAAGRITYITSRGRRIAAVVPLAVAEEAEDADGWTP